MTPVQFEFFHKLFEFLIDFLLLASNVILKFTFVLFCTMQNDTKFKINSRNHSSAIGCKTCNLKLKKLQPKVAISLCNFQLLLQQLSVEKNCNQELLATKTCNPCFFTTIGGTLVALWLHIFAVQVNPKKFGHLGPILCKIDLF